MEDPRVLISVLNYNNFLFTKSCVQSILNIQKKNTEILIVDNNSSDNSYSNLKKEFPKLKNVKSKINGGYAFGHKISVDYALKNNFEFIWILNNDLTVRNNTLEALLSSAIKYGPGLFGSISLKSESPDIVNFGGGVTGDISKPFNYNSFENFTLEKYLKETSLRPVQSIEGSSFLISTEVIEKHGFMSEDFFMYGEETDYCYRLNKLGIKSFVVPESIVIHKGAESLKEKKYLEKYYRRRNFIFFEKSHYSVSKIKNISKKTGVFNCLKYFLSFYLQSKPKDDLYYQNLANVHALINKRGKLND